MAMPSGGVDCKVEVAVAVEVRHYIVGATGTGVVDAAEFEMEATGAEEDADAFGGRDKNVCDAIAVQVGYRDKVAAVAGGSV